VGILQDVRSREGKPLVIVLDGLDEAEDTFDPPFPSPLPAGVFVIASARAEINDEPEYLRNWTEGAERFYLDRLPREAIASWLEKIDELASYSQDSDFVKKLDEITGGFPLYLGFLIEDLKREAKQPAAKVREVLAQTPKGFEGYVKQQLKLLDELSNKQDWSDKLWQFFAVLAVAKGVLRKEDIKKLTGMRDRDLRQLGQSWQVTRWMQISEETLYTFAHPLLATTFAKQLGDDAEDALNNLIDYCAKWQEHQSLYALRHYAEHLREAKHWPELYELARSEAFAGAQQEKLPDDPDLPLRTVQVALRSAAETDNAGGMAEFLLAHARRQQQITGQETPLKALRAGSLERAWRLAEQFDMERRALWYLLLAWELAGDNPEKTGRIEEAKKTLERLQSKDLPRFSKDKLGSLDNWKADFAVELLAQDILAVKAWNFSSVARQLLSGGNLKKLSESLVKRGALDSATEVARQIDDSDDRFRALKEIALAQVNAGSIAAARSTLEEALPVARQIDDSSFRALALKEIALALVNAGSIDADGSTLEEALPVARQIDNSHFRAEALKEIALAQVEAGSTDAARSTLEEAVRVAQQIDYSRDRAEAFKDIALAQVKAGSTDAARSTLEEAWRVAQQIEVELERAKIVEEIATAAVKAGLSRQALFAAEKILVNRNEHLPKIAAAFVETGDKASFKQLLIPCASDLDAAYTLCELLTRLYPEKENVEAVAKVAIGEKN